MYREYRDLTVAGAVTQCCEFGFLHWSPWSCWHMVLRVVLCSMLSVLSQGPKELYCSEVGHFFSQTR